MSQTKIRTREEEVLIEKIVEVIRSWKRDEMVLEVAEQVLDEIFSPGTAWAVRQKLGIPIHHDPDWQRIDAPDVKVFYMYRTLNHSYYIHRPTTMGTPIIFRKTIIGDEWEQLVKVPASRVHA
jgi:hypothetical protein